MLILAHAGIGGRVASLASRSVAPGWCLLGALLPDLLDKPLFHATHLCARFLHSGVGVFTCTRTLGHSWILLLALVMVAAFQRSRLFLALALGAAVHVGLDVLQDALAPAPWFPTSVQALVFPLVEGGFGTHKSVAGPWVLVPFELLGLGCLLTWGDLRQALRTRAWRSLFRLEDSRDA